MFLDVGSSQLFGMQEGFRGRGALQAPGKRVSPYERVSPHIGNTAFASPSLPRSNLPIAFMFLTSWGSSQLPRYRETGLSLLQTTSQHRAVSAETGPGLAVSKEHPWEWGG